MANLQLPNRKDRGRKDSWSGEGESDVSGSFKDREESVELFACLVVFGEINVIFRNINSSLEGQHSVVKSTEFETEPVSIQI